MNSEWLIHFPSSFLKHLPFLGSDHCPIFFNMSSNDVLSSRNWKFFKCWLRDNIFQTQTNKAWAKHFNGSATYSLEKKLFETIRNPSLWNIPTFGNIQEQLKSLQKQLTFLQQPDTTSDNTAKVKEIEKDIKEWHIREEEFYKQNARNTLFNEVYQNTKHFHL